MKNSFYLCCLTERSRLSNEHRISNLHLIVSDSQSRSRLSYATTQIGFCVFGVTQTSVSGCGSGITPCLQSFNGQNNSGIQMFRLLRSVGAVCKVHIQRLEV